MVLEVWQEILVLVLPAGLCALGVFASGLASLSPNQRVNQFGDKWLKWVLVLFACSMAWAAGGTLFL